jgi:hypothetical protein
MAQEYLVHKIGDRYIIVKKVESALGTEFRNEGDYSSWTHLAERTFQSLDKASLGKAEHEIEANGTTRLVI